MTKTAIAPYRQEKPRSLSVRRLTSLKAWEHPLYVRESPLALDLEPYCM
ncbi:MAG: hypothetical protein VKL42_23930 [Snowella sp.]|nr:hypothetical protein [Snowella sp.]